MKKLDTFPRILLLLAGLVLIPVLFLPFWKIELIAPQYPEGLEMKIWTNKLSGSVDIINGLNHYIGMKKIKEEEFIEFKILPILIIVMAALGVLAAAWGRVKGLYVYFALFVFVSVISLADFYHWLWDYGHNLDPTAPIQVPGMAYQPPLIGYKQLLNFQAFSFPDVGGFFFTACGVLAGIAVLLTVLRERKIALLNKSNNSNKHDNGDMKKGNIATASLLLMLVACATGPQPIKYGTDQCEYCKMTIMDKRFAGEIATTKGKAYKFDDVRCVVDFLNAGTVKQDNIEGTYLTTYDGANEFVRVEEAHFTKAEDLRSPMGGNIAAFKDATSRDKVMNEMKGRTITWGEINKK